MADLESMRLPIATVGTGPGVEGKEWLSSRDVVRNIDRWHKAKDRILVVPGEEDHIIQNTQQRTISEFAASIRARREADSIRTGQIDPGTRLFELPRTGHHLQNDLYWEHGAEAVLEFLRQLQLR